MNANWDRHDDTTKFLFARESDVLNGDFETQARLVLPKLKDEFDRLANEGIANSHGLDNFLQVAMAWITTYLGERIGAPDVRATISRYLRDPEAVQVKPCLVKPGLCRAPQPTISLKEDAAVRGVGGRIGHTGVSLKLGEILYCRPNLPECAEYITIDSGPNEKADTRAALCIPFDSRLGVKAEFTSCDNGPVCKSDRYRELSPAKSADGSTAPTNQKEKMRARWVLNIESVSDKFTRDFALEILKKDEFLAVVNKLIEMLDTYQKERDMHLALERSSTLLALAANNLQPRPAYRALLREISKVCDGADVTLHLRDLMDVDDPKETHEQNESRKDRNRSRCSVFVTGAGQNYGDFLVNERIGLEVGQIGWALSEKEWPDNTVSGSALHLNSDDESKAPSRVQYIVGEEITEAMKGTGTLAFKQLMPDTVLNVTVPIFFHKLKIGVINIEWDKAHLTKGDPRFGNEVKFSELHDLKGRNFLEDEYLSSRMKVVYRMADYLSLVIDYFDDLKHLFQKNITDLNDKETLKQLSRDGALRRVMGYYVSQGMNKADECPAEKSIREVEETCLQDLVDAVGYFLASSTKLRILVSVRRVSKDGNQLEQHVHHWPEEPKSISRNKEPIPIIEFESVLGTCAYQGIPLFGPIEGDEKHLVLKVDKVCADLLRDPPTTVKYRQAGPNPRYEVGVPLIFGSKLLGTFDLEQFEPNPKVQSAPQGLTEIELCSYLQWARAIAFLLAYIEDTRDNFSEFVAFERFVLLCAQLIAEVPVAPQQFLEIATNAFAEIVPVQNASIGKDTSTNGNKLRKLAQLRFRGGGESILSWDIDKSAKSLMGSEVEAEPGKTVTAMMTNYHALMQVLPTQRFGDDTFREAIEKIIVELKDNETELLDPSRGASDALLNVFRFLNEKLRTHLMHPLNEFGHEHEPFSQTRESAKSTKPNRYAWFLHLRRYDSEDENQYWVSDPDSPLAKTPLSYCYTQEVADILYEVKKTMAEESDAKRALATVLRGRVKNTEFREEEFKKVIDEITNTLPDNAKEDDILQTIATQLSRRKRDKPDTPPGLMNDDEEEIPSFTNSVAAGDRAIVVPDLNLSPNRSARDHGWFWRYTYTVVGMPFMLDKTCIAVLNVFRKRNDSIDNNFFRIEEREVAQELVNTVNELLTKLVRVERFEKPSEEKFDKEFASLRNYLVKLSTNNPEGKTRLIVVRSPFARSEESFEVILKHLFGDGTDPSLHKPLRLKNWISDTVVVDRIDRGLKKIEALREFALNLPTLIANTKCIFLFTANAQDLEIDGNPVYVGAIPADSYDDFALRRNTERDEDLYRRWLVGRVMDQIASESNVVARRIDNWTHEEFTQWVLNHGKEVEGADLYHAKRHLSDPQSWRPTKHLFCLNRWDVEPVED